MEQSFQVGDRVKVYFDAKFGEEDGWYQGTVFKIDPYSEHRSFYWVALDEHAQAMLGVGQISVFNLKDIQIVHITQFNL
jgi:hypothetical protein